MAQLYYDLIKQGLWTIEKVPAYWHDEVEKMLQEANLTKS